MARKKKRTTIKHKTKKSVPEKIVEALTTFSEDLQKDVDIPQIYAISTLVTLPLTTDELVPREGCAYVYKGEMVQFLRREADLAVIRTIRGSKESKVPASEVKHLFTLAS